MNEITKPTITSFTAGLIVAASCIAWTAGVYLTVDTVFELTPASGWILAGALGVLALGSLAVLIHEFRHAIDLTGYVDPLEFTGVALPPRKRASNPGPAPLLRGARFRAEGNLC